MSQQGHLRISHVWFNALRIWRLIYVGMVTVALSPASLWSDEAVKSRSPGPLCTSSDLPTFVFPFAEGDKVGYIDATGRVVICPTFARPGRPIRRRCDGSEQMITATEYCRSLAWCPESAERTRANGIEDGLEFLPEFQDGVAIVVRGRAFGFLREDGTVLFAPQFESVCDFVEGTAWASKDKKYSLIDDHGRLLGKGYDAWQRLSRGVFGVRLGSRWGVIDDRGVLFLAPQFDRVESCEKGVAVVSVGGKSGVVDLAGRVLIEPMYDRIRVVGMGRVAAKGGGVWRLADSRGAVLGPNEYEDTARAFSEGLLAVQQRGRWGYVDEEGKLAIAPRFETALAFAEGRAAVGLNGKYGFVDREGNVVVQPEFDDVGNYDQGVAVVTAQVGAESRYGLIDRFGDYRLRIDSGCRRIGPWHGDVAVVWYAGHPTHGSNQRGAASQGASLAGVIDRRGTMLLKPAFSNLQVIGPNRYLVWKGETVRMVDGAGRCLALSDRTYVWASGVLSEGMRAVAIGEDQPLLNENRSRGRKYGFVDRWGKLIIPPAFDYAEPFRGGLARVNVGGGRTIDGEIVGGRWGYIDRMGKPVGAQIPGP